MAARETKAKATTKKLGGEARSAKRSVTEQQLENLARGRATQREEKRRAAAGALPTREGLRRAHYTLGCEAIRLARRKLREVGAGKASSGAEVAAFERLLRLGVDLQREAVGEGEGEERGLAAALRGGLRFTMGEGGG